MWILVTICLVGMLLFFSVASVVVLSYEEIEPWLKRIVLITFIPMILGMVSLFAVTVALEKEREENNGKPRYELIKEPVYRKIN